MQDTMWAAVFATAPATVILRCGGSSNSFNVGAGVSKLKIPLAPGKMTVQMIRNGQTTINYTPDEFTYVANPVVCKARFFRFFLFQDTKEFLWADNYNAWVGSASRHQKHLYFEVYLLMLTLKTNFFLKAASNSAPAPPPPPTTTTTSTSLASSPTNTPTNGGYTYVHCYQDDNSRILSQSTDYNNAQTIDKCLAKCASGGYAYAGLEYGKECYCSNTLRANAVQAPESECAMRCAGDGEFGSNLVFFLIWRLCFYLFVREPDMRWVVEKQCVQDIYECIELDVLWLCC